MGSTYIKKTPASLHTIRPELYVRGSIKDTVLISEHF